MRKLLFTFVLALTLVLPLPAYYAQRKSTKPAADGISSTARTGADLITAEELKDYLYFIAADAMEGRDTPSRGLDTAANFIAYNLSRWGFKPAGDNGTYFQKIGLSRARVDPSKTRAEINGRSYNYGDDFLAQPIAGTASGPLVYVGHGYVVKDKNIDAYKGVDVSGKIMVITGGLPRGMNFRDFRGEEGTNYESPAGYARRHGAVGIIVIPNYTTLAGWNLSRQAATERGVVTVDKFQPTTAGTGVPSITVSASILNAIFQSEKVDGAEIFNRRTSGEPGDAFDINKRASFTVGATTDALQTQNVVGIVEGTDPMLKNEYIALGAHYDHVGTNNPGCRPIGNDTICNGADDDGSGTTALLALAEALGKGPKPKRSILFVWHCGEEKGLWGSRYFTDNPTIPLNQIAAQLNIDMIGRSKREGDTNPRNRELSGPNEIYVIGSKMMSTELGDLTERVNKNFLNLSFNYKYDDPNDPNRFFFRSDHFNYAQKGIPIVFFFDGEHEDYHRPGDEPQKIDYQKMEKVTRTVYMMMWELANQPARPKVDKQLPAQLTGSE